MKYHLTYPAVLALFAGSVANADVYRWTDADGNVHFGDVSQAKGEIVEIRTADAAEPGSTTEPDPVPPSDPDDLRAQNCEKATKRLTDYEKADSLLGEDEYGRKREITGEERVDLILRAQKDVEEFCGEATADAPAVTEPAKTPSDTAAEAPAPQREASPAAEGNFDGSSLSAY